MVHFVAIKGAEEKLVIKTKRGGTRFCVLDRITALSQKKLKVLFQKTKHSKVKFFVSKQRFTRREVAGLVFQKTWVSGF